MKERGGALWEWADGVCLAVSSYVEGGLVTRGDGGRGLLLGRTGLAGLSALLQG